LSENLIVVSSIPSSNVTFDYDDRNPITFDSKVKVVGRLEK